MIVNIYDLGSAYESSSDESIDWEDMGLTKEEADRLL